MSEYIPTIGLEVHAELKTQTKMFCASKNDPDEERPNANICPVCMSHPGTLPVINREAVRHVLRVGAAIGGTLADYTEFDRKNYFYPDLPKGYQISQYEYPLVQGGELAGVALTRIHLEEDTARSSHDATDGTTKIDYNRAGVPLMELVTEPVIRSAEDAGRFARELQLLLRYLGAGEANMEKGEMRVEANISISKDGGVSGTKVEVKNLNSFRAVERAIAYELQRQQKVLEQGGELVQETRGWDENKQETFSQRAKEGSADYRYFPDPDLPSLKISEIPEFSHEQLVREMPELPWQARERYSALALSAEDVELYVRDRTLGAFFDAVATALTQDYARTDLARTASNYIATDLVKLLRDIDIQDAELSQNTEISLNPSYFAKLIVMAADGDLSSRGAKDTLAHMVQSPDTDPESIAKDKGLLQASDTETLGKIVAEVIEANGAVADEYRAGKDAALQFLVGQGMKLSKGSANPGVLKELLQKALGA